MANRRVPSVLPPQTQLIGRGAELARCSDLLEAVAAVDSSAGVVLLVSGEAGIGKTRFLHELFTVADAAGFDVLVGRCFEQYATVPFSPFTEVFASRLAATPTEVRSEIAGRWPDLAQVVPDLGASAV
jgi:predicted ATPase